MQRLRQDVCIGYNIRMTRVQNGFTQESIASKLQLMGSNTTRSVYSRYETGELNIRVSDLIRLRKLFGCHYDDFFAGLEEQLAESNREDRP